MRWYGPVGIVLAGICILAASIILSPAKVVTTQGSSMAPRPHGGDLALVWPAARYEVGDIAAYRSDLLRSVVLHRIVAVDNGRYTFKGDSNSWLDEEKPTRDSLIGTLALRVPHAGAWLRHLTSFSTTGLSALFLLTALGTAAETTRRRRRMKVISHAGRHTGTGSASQSQLRSAAGSAAIIGVAGLALGALAWSGPVEQMATTEAHAQRQIAFSYAAQVPRTAAYDTTSVEPPQPVFRKLANAVDVRYGYQGDPGTIAVAAELSNSSGWRLTVPLAARTTFATDRYTGKVRLDLDALQERADAAAAVTGMPNDQLDITVIPTITSPGGDTFTPRLPLALTPLHLAPKGNIASMTVKDSTATKKMTLAPRTFSVFERDVPVATVRKVSLVMLGASLLAALVIALISGTWSRAGEPARIRRQYGSLLVSVQPMEEQPEQPLVDVTHFATLAKLAERYGLLIMHWSSGRQETFVVKDASATYRYRTPNGAEATAWERSDIDARSTSHPSAATGVGVRPGEEP